MAKHIDDAVLNYLADQIQRLTPDEQEWLLNNLTDLVRERMTEIGEPAHSLLELEGLGAEIWKGIDAQQYINEERDAWR